MREETNNTQFTQAEADAAEALLDKLEQERHTEAQLSKRPFLEKIEKSNISQTDKSVLKEKTELASEGDLSDVKNQLEDEVEEKQEQLASIVQEQERVERDGVPPTPVENLEKALDASQQIVEQAAETIIRPELVKEDDPKLDKEVEVIRNAQQDEQDVPAMDVDLMQQAALNERASQASPSDDVDDLELVQLSSEEQEKPKPLTLEEITDLIREDDLRDQTKANAKDGVEPKETKTSAKTHKSSKAFEMLGIDEEKAKEPIDKDLKTTDQPETDKEVVAADKGKESKQEVKPEPTLDTKPQQVKYTATPVQLASDAEEMRAQGRAEKNAGKGMQAAGIAVGAAAMVALVAGGPLLIVAMLAAAAFGLHKSGQKAEEAGQELRDDARFASNAPKTGYVYTPIIEPKVEHNKEADKEKMAEILKGSEVVKDLEKGVSKNESTHTPNAAVETDKGVQR